MPFDSLDSNSISRSLERNRNTAMAGYLNYYADTNRETAVDSTPFSEVSSPIPQQPKDRQDHQQIDQLQMGLREMDNQRLPSRSETPILMSPDLHEHHKRPTDSKYCALSPNSDAHLGPLLREGRDLQRPFDSSRYKQSAKPQSPSMNRSKHDLHMENNVRGLSKRQRAASLQRGLNEKKPSLEIDSEGSIEQRKQYSPIRNSLRNSNMNFSTKAVHNAVNSAERVANTRTNSITRERLDYPEQIPIKSTMSASSQLLLSLKKMNTQGCTRSVPVKWEQKVSNRINQRNVGGSNDRQSMSATRDNRSASASFALTSTHSNERYNDQFTTENSTTRSFQRQIDTLSRDLDDRSRRWESMMHDCSSKLQNLKEQLSCEQLMEGGKHERDQGKSFEAAVRSELQKLHEYNEKLVMDFRNNILNSLEEQLSIHREEMDNRMKEELSHIESIKGFFTTTLPELKNGLEEGRRRRKELNIYFEEIVNNQSNVWLDVLDSCQRKCEDVKNEVDERLEKFVDIVISKVEEMETVEKHMP